MAVSNEIIESYTRILKGELIPAMGCTEPIAIAYASSILRHALGGEPIRARLGLSGNIIKNVKSVTVPATGGMHGIAAAYAAGVIAGCPERRLEVLSVLAPSDRARIAEYMENVELDISELDTERQFEIELSGSLGEVCARVRFEDRHTNVVLVEKDGENITSSYVEFGGIGGCACDDIEVSTDASDRDMLNVKDIVAFAESVPLDDNSEGSLVYCLDRQIEMNMAIAREGLEGDWGASIGKILIGADPDSIRVRARAYAAAGSDARMSGCEMPVCILSGSGNQGITASVPVVVYAEALGADRETLLRALIVSDLMTIHQKGEIGCLSAYCGAISAGCGCGCGIAYLHGGRYYEIAHTFVNSVAVLSGTICDGAKASCAAKIAMAVDAGIMGYEMTRAGRQFYGGDGIVTKGVENTIRNVGRLARDGMSGTDREIIRMMLED